MSSLEVVASAPQPTGTKPSKGKAFWLTFLALVVSLFLGALDLTAVGTALPTITQDLNGGENFVWVGSAYALSSTAILPLSGALADVFGRRPVMLLSIAFFTIGSALAGAAQNMNMLIAARTVQGIGTGGILNLSEIITSDLVPLAERGIYQGMLGLTWSFASGIGPPIGGSLAQKASWRWIFYINLPLTGIAFVLVIFFLRVRTPEGSLREKLGRIDWIGNLIIIAGTTLAVIGLTWGGIRFPWNSAKVLAPLIIGMCLVGFFIYYEAKFPKDPTIPFDIIANRTSFSGYMSTMFHGITSISIFYYLPVYFQACLNATPIRSAVDLLATALVVAPWALLCGIVVQTTNKYRPMNALGWVFITIGFGLLSMLRADSSVGQWVGFQFIAAAGTGILYAGTVFPVLAPLPVSRTAAALAFFAFLRAFAQTWGITISSTILQNELKKNLPPDFISQFPQGLEIAYAAIPKIRTLQEPLRTEVRQAFSKSMSIVWETMIGISGLGLLTLLLLREIPLNQTTDENYGLVDGERAAASHSGATSENHADDKA